jgi:hypothetical protein
MHTLRRNFKILLGIATFGLLPAFRPGYVHWSDPPISESMRRSRQRRWRPEGYPWKSDRLPAEKKKQLLKALFSWTERWCLFWTTPIVLFYVDKIMYVAFTLMFSIWFVAHRQAVDSDSGEHKIIIMPFRVSRNLDEESLQSVEIALCIYFGSSFLREVTEVLCELGTAATLQQKVDVLVDYFSSLWNVLDVGEIIAFCVGIGYRVSIAARLSALAGKISFDEFIPASTTTPALTTTTPAPGSGEGSGGEYQGELWTNWSMAYGICLSIAWFRVLRSGDALP